jgi:hypothetical protein
MRFLMILSLTTAGLLAQDPAPPPAPPPPGSVSGRVIDADTNAPIPDIQVRASGPATDIVRTDEKGYYKLTGLKPGPLWIAVRAAGAGSTMPVNVMSDAELRGVDFRVRQDGEISGRVYDENKDPIIALQVHVIMREYQGGAIRYFTSGMRATTNDRGEYIVHGVPAGRAMFVMFEPLKVYPNPVSKAPADPKLRRPAYHPTYYPGSDSRDTATMVTLRSGEKRERVDIQILRSPSYCIDGTLFEDGKPASLDFKVTDLFTAGPNSAAAGGKSALDGKIRVCDLYPGQFRITALRQGEREVFGATSVTIDHEDVHDVRVFATGPGSIQGDVEWDGPPPANADAARFSFYLSSGVLDGLVWGAGRYEPSPFGPFSFPALPVLDYEMQPRIAPPDAFPNAYVKDITYGPSSVFHQRFRAQNELTLRVSVANDGSFIKVNAPAGAQILILPATAATEAMLSDAMIHGEADSFGAYTSSVVAPGKYHVLATYEVVDRTPECIANIWRERNRGQEVDVGPKATAPVTLLDVTSLQPRQ